MVDTISEEGNGAACSKDEINLSTATNANINNYIRAKQRTYKDFD